MSHLDPMTFSSDDVLGPYILIESHISMGLTDAGKLIIMMKSEFHRAEANENSALSAFYSPRLCRTMYLKRQT